ncbi:MULTISPECIES: hypothetical protein [unclassified Beijerinckia]|uniref:hypothetical protein n=1 Tax=unclassified Beijerinckia TaxID=2638183 RepID=UPI0008947E82|nr:MULTISPECIES: hypothetical protein [unclassified Beijerinckia]MDH7794767.1 preprotein translocase subunit SecY [Beijerinckia sp. GAS462]SEB74414.1 Preprotein translocase subunit SecY [Beijerinckia sp. 28-YEA-48]
MEQVQTVERPWRHVAVIIGVLMIYALGSKIPLPGLDVDKLIAVGAGGNALRFSIMALGLTPVLTVLIVFEVAKLLFPKLDQRQAAAPSKTDRILRTLALVLATVQGGSVLIAMQRAGLFEADEGGLVLAGVAALVGGTLLLIWLADRIVLPGLGNGFWLLWIAPLLAGLAPQVATAIMVMRNGAMGTPQILMGIAYVLIASAAVVVANVVMTRGRGEQEKRQSVQALIWPPLLANVAAGYIATLFYLGFSLSTWGLVVARWILLVPLIVLFVFAYARKPVAGRAADQLTREPVMAPAAVWLLLCLLQLALCVGGELLTDLLGLPWQLNGGLLIITVTVMTSLLRLVSSPRVSATASA